jgi:hypothetical protein
MFVEPICGKMAKSDNHHWANPIYHGFRTWVLSTKVSFATKSVSDPKQNGSWSLGLNAQGLSHKIALSSSIIQRSKESPSTTLYGHLDLGRFGRAEAAAFLCCWRVDAAPRLIHLMMDEPGDTHLLVVAREREEHGTDSGLADGLSHSLYCLPFESTQMEEALMQIVISWRSCRFLSKSAHGRWTDHEVLPGVTGLFSHHSRSGADTQCDTRTKNARPST